MTVGGFLMEHWGGNPGKPSWTKIRCWNPARSPDNPPSATPSFFICFSLRVTFFFFASYVGLMKEDHPRVPAFLSSRFKCSGSIKLEYHIILNFLEEIWFGPAWVAFLPKRQSVLHTKLMNAHKQSQREESIYNEQICQNKKQKNPRTTSSAYVVAENHKMLELEEL